MNASVLCALLLAAALAMSVTACWGEDAGTGRSSGGGLIEGRSDSALAGFINVKRRGGALKLLLNVMNAAPGDHALRLHQVGDCSASDASSAGGLWIPEGTSSDGVSLAELGNLHVDEDGRGHLATSGPYNFGDGSELDLVGHALVIHQKSSELLAQGDDDARIGCAVIR